MNMAQLAAYVATKTGLGGLNNMDATDDPDANDDTGSGYEIGSMWYNQTSNALFVAESVGAAAAVWTNVSATVTEKVLEDLWQAAATPILATGDKFPFADVSGTDTIGTATAPDICSTGGALLKDGTTDLTGDLVINERADHADTPTAGKGQVWVRSDTPNVLVYTDDAGTDTVLGAAGDYWTDQVDSDIIPDTTNTYDLGSAAARFAECHVTTLDVNGNITLLGTVDGRDVAADGAILDSITPTSKYETAVVSDFPDATDDSLGVFALWIHTTDQRAWICVDDTAATAVWLELATGAGDAWGDVVDAVITPDADGTRDLGLTGTRFATAYVDDLDVTTNIVVGGTVDGRDVAADGTTLDALEGVNHTESAGPPLATWDSDDATGDLVAHTVGDTHYDTATQLVYTCEDATATAAVWYAKNRRVVHFFSSVGKFANVLSQSLGGVFTVPGVITKIVFNSAFYVAQDASNYWEFDFFLNDDTTNFILAAPKDMNSSQNINQFGSYDMGAMTATTAYKTVAVGDTLKVDWQAGAGTPASLGGVIQGYTVWVDTAIV
jgi:hypothetical protein